MKHSDKYDVIVVGAGHAGCEAAHIAGTMGSKVLLITMNMETIAKMSCNPAMGGVAKGQILREIDALGGMSAIIADASTMQFRMLNTSKGPAMWSPRTQNDRTKFSLKWREALENNRNIDFIQESVIGITEHNSTVTGVNTSFGNIYEAHTVILTSGTFMNGIIHIGNTELKGGRMGDKASYGITEQLNSLGFQSGRMKTGTPPRVDGRTINYDVLTEQKGDEDPRCFSFRKPHTLTKQHSCHITYTNPQVHDILRENLDSSPLYNGTIQSIGPRYCPSIEDKINRFAERDRHQIFVEPEGWHTYETYINGFSSSLPQEIQYRALKLVPGFEKAKVFRPGYAIEYDFFYPTQLNHTLETKGVKGLYFAGQINGTTGYEEAACQGLIAGINASLRIQNKPEFILSRSEAYIGVLIDDLINKGTNEPYRMFTSRAEYRILLRQDNADERLMPKAYALGTISKETYERYLKKKQRIQDGIAFLEKTTIKPADVNPILEENNTAPIPQNYFATKILARPQIHLHHLLNIGIVQQAMGDYSRDELEQTEIKIKYDGYIKQEEENAQKLQRLEHLIIPQDFDYQKVISLSAESKDKLSKIKPTSIGQASRISGVSPSDVSVLLVHFGR